VSAGSPTTTALMRVVVPKVPGGPDVLRVVRRPVPTPGRGDVVIRTAAAGVNRADLMQRAGAYPLSAELTDVLGLEVSGTVVAAGPDVPDHLLGADVCALLPGGGYAEQVRVRATHVAHVPQGVSVVDAGGLIEVAATVWSNLFMPAPPPRGSWLLVHGGASGIGAIAVQLAVAHGLRVATTVGSPEKGHFVRRLGAELVVDHRREDFAGVLLERGIRPAAVLDIVGADYLDRNLAVLARGGRLAVIGHQSGANGIVDLGRLLTGNLTVTGSGLRMRPDAEKDEIVRQLANHVWPLFGSGHLAATTFATFGLDQAADAHRLLEASGHRGKVLLLP
jgi:NADPH:quinone reductase